MICDDAFGCNDGDDHDEVMILQFNTAAFRDLS